MQEPQWIDASILIHKLECRKDEFLKLHPEKAGSSSVAMIEELIHEILLTVQESGQPSVCSQEEETLSEDSI
jgi:hypothetical protein